MIALVEEMELNTLFLYRRMQLYRHILITEMYVSLPDRPACHKNLRNSLCPDWFVTLFVSPTNKYRKKCGERKILKSGTNNGC